MKSMPMLIALVLTTLPAAAALAHDVAQSAAVATETDVGKTGTGTGTGTGTVVASTGPSPWTLQARSSSISSPRTMTVTAVIPADLDAVSETTASYTVPLSSSDPACTLPESVTLQWSSAAGALGSVQVDCAKVSSNRTVTITGGTASTSFTLMR